MIKCTGEDCPKKLRCMRYDFMALEQPHFKGSNKDADGNCTRYIPLPEDVHDDDLAGDYSQHVHTKTMEDTHV